MYTLRADGGGKRTTRDIIDYVLQQKGVHLVKGFEHVLDSSVCEPNADVVASFTETSEAFRVMQGRSDHLVWETAPIPASGTADVIFLFDMATGYGSPIPQPSGRFDVFVNGQAVASTDAGWWTDISFRKVDVSGAVRAGRNEIMLSGILARDTELESVYVIGDFGVAGHRLGEENRLTGQVFDRYTPEFRVTDLPHYIRAKGNSDGLSIDLTAQGLPFFAGRATLRQTVTLPPLQGRTRLEVHNLRAAVAHVGMNGQHMGAIAWRPHRVDVSAGLRPGENVIEIELVGTLRNLLGPHHLVGGDLDWTGPGEFLDKSRWTDDYILVPFGFAGVTLTTFGSWTVS